MYDVVIVGYGHVGATLAALLGELGLRVAVFDKSEEIYPKPRAVGFDHDAMRLFQRIGICDDLQPYIEPFRDELYIDSSGREIQRITQIPEPFPLSWQPYFTCNQPAIEQALRTGIAHMSNVSISLGTEYLKLQQLPDRVLVHLRTSDGRHVNVQCQYLIGCDGATSSIRQQLGIRLQNLDYDEPWIVVDVLVDNDILRTLPQTNVQYCIPERPCTMICCPGNHRRWEFMQVVSEIGGESISDQHLWELLSPWLQPGQAKIWRAAAYRFHALVAEEWRQNRVFLVGDSAHQTPPFLGQGMCQGLRDAGNLAWKLHAVLSGRAHEDLLETYVVERRPHVVETTRRAIEFRLVISELDPQIMSERHEAILASSGGQTKVIPRENLIPNLKAGMVDIRRPMAGCVFPQPLVDTAEQCDQLMDNLTDNAFRLVILANTMDPEEVTRIIPPSHIVLQVIHTSPLKEFTGPEVVDKHNTLHSWFADAGCVGAVVRPDHYVYAAVTSFIDLRECLDSLCSRMGWSPSRDNPISG
jgi:3-(3-hydroxy-phenyl)propionate hydroxylase